MTAPLIQCEVDSREFGNFVKKLSESVGNPKVVRRILRPAMNLITKALRRRTTSPPAVAVEARKTIGVQLRSRSKHITTAKVGYALRKGTSKHAEGAPGVGLSWRNIHWPVLGTDERVTKSGAGRGRMPAYFRGAVEAAKNEQIRSALRLAEELAYKEVVRIQKGGR